MRTCAEASSLDTPFRVIHAETHELLQGRGDGAIWKTMIMSVALSSPHRGT